MARLLVMLMFLHQSWAEDLTFPGLGVLWMMAASQVSIAAALAGFNTICVKIAVAAALVGSLADMHPSSTVCSQDGVKPWTALPNVEL